MFNIWGRLPLSHESNTEIKTLVEHSSAQQHSIVTSNITEEIKRLSDIKRISKRKRRKIALTIGAVSISETTVNLCQTTRRNIPQESHFHISRRENLKSHTENKYGCRAAVEAILWFFFFGNITSEICGFDLPAGIIYTSL